MPEAAVYILTRPLENLGGIFSVFGDGGKHWGLIVEFLDGSGVYLCEITTPDNVDIATAMVYTSVSASGTAVRRCEKFRSIEACKERNQEAEIKRYGKCSTTVEQLKFLTFNIKLGSYHVIVSNCQKFVEELIETLNVCKGTDHNGNLICMPTSSTEVAVIGAGLLLGGALGLLFSQHKNTNKNN